MHGGAILDIAYALYVYNAVVRKHSFAEAARELNISVTTASRLVSELEEDLGARLLQRTTRKLNVTEAGLLVYNHGREILNDLDDLRSSISILSESVQGIVRLTCPISFGVRVLMPLMPKFQASYPKVSLEVSLTNRFVDMIDEGFDVAVRFGDQMPSTTIVRPLGQSASSICGAPGYLKQHGSPRTPQELSNHASVIYKSPGNIDDSYEVFDHEGTPVVVKATGLLFVDSTDAMREAVLNGSGLGLFPRYSIADDLAHGRLVELFRGTRTTDAAILYPHRRHLSRKIRALVDYLAQNIQLA
jgi:DNA-binding transcriptional LysR family regulator